MSDHTLNLIGNVIGFVGLAALIVGAFPGEALATRFAHVGLLGGGRAFAWHRVAGVAGLVLFLAHPIPFLFRVENYGLAFPTYLAPVNGIKVNLGILAFYALALTAVTGLLTRTLPRWLWRNVHWLAYAMLGLACVHGLLLSEEGAAWQQVLMYMLCGLGVAVLVARAGLTIAERRPIPLHRQRAAARHLHQPQVTLDH